MDINTVTHNPALCENLDNLLTKSTGHAEDLSALSDADLFARIHANLDAIAANNLAAFDAAIDALFPACVKGAA